MVRVKVSYLLCGCGFGVVYGCRRGFMDGRRYLKMRKYQPHPGLLLLFIVINTITPQNNYNNFLILYRMG